jgi:hypothetical protein
MMVIATWLGMLAATLFLIAMSFVEVLREVERADDWEDSDHG